MKLTDPSIHLRKVTVIGGGLAGTEAAWQLATRGIAVRLIEMRPVVASAAHHTDLLGELVCSNSLKSEAPDSAAGALKGELAAMGSLVLSAAQANRVPAGGALAVDRERFARSLTASIEAHPLITLVRAEATDLPDGQVIVATGPLTSTAMEVVLTRLIGGGQLAFFDAAAPIVDVETIDLDVVFSQSRYDKGGTADYLNAPMSKAEYDLFYDELVGARRVTSKDFERSDLFHACQPVEEVARTGRDSLRFGAMKPVGLTDPRDGSRPWAVVQLRAENVAGTAYNLVGFQTNLAFGEQDRVFRMIPGLERAEFLRHGVMHRNTFVDAPRVLDSSFALKSEQRIRLAGQLTGTEGYSEAAASGLLAALNTYADIVGVPRVMLPVTTALGALVAYATDPETKHYEPMHVNFGLIPALSPPVKGKRDRYAAYAVRASHAMCEWRESRADLFPASGAVGA